MGRPRKFDPDKALDRALKVFWKKGYEGTSLPDLTRAMRINRPSMYAAFGNKEALFRKALDRYVAVHHEMLAEALRAPTARAAIERLLFASAGAQCSSGNPRGCMLVSGALSCGSEGEPIRRELIARRGVVECMLRERFEQALRDGELRDGVSAADLARFYATVMQGMSVQAAGGVAPEALRSVAETALRAWPT